MTHDLIKAMEAVGNIILHLEDVMPGNTSHPMYHHLREIMVDTLALQGQLTRALKDHHSLQVTTMMGELTEHEKDLVARDDKIGAIKCVRARTGHDLKAAKELVENYIYNEQRKVAKQ